MMRLVVNYQDREAQQRLLRLLQDTHPCVVADVETTGLRPYHGDKVIGLALYFPGLDESYYVVVRHPDNNVSEDYWREVLRLLPRSATTLVGFNIKFDLHFLGREGMADPVVVEDVMVAAQLLNENESLSNNFQTKGAYQLKRLARKYLGAEAGAGEDFLKAAAKERGLDPKREMWLLPADIVAPYALADVEITWQLREFYMPGLERWRQVELYQQRNAFVLKALLRAERNGVRVNVETIEKHQAEINPRLIEIQSEFDAEMDRMGLKLTDKKDTRRINLNSPQQLKAFFELLGWQVAATDKFVLTGMSKSGERWATLLLEYRTLNKANSTYYAPYLYHVDPDGFIHTTLNPIGTETGRLSSYDPNLQQIPRGSEKFKIKEIFEPRPGYASFGSDYKQLELRLGVHFANEETMRRMFNSGEDMHQWTADRLGVSRQIGKGANFGLLYGMGAQRAMMQLGISTLEEAQRVVTGWRDLYPAFMVALKTWEAQAQEWRNPDGSPGGKYQFIRLFNGRVRHYQEYLKYRRYDDDGSLIPPPYRDAWNFYIQGTGAAIAEASILRVCKALPDNDIFKPILPVHDALEYEVAIDHVNEVVPVVEELLADWPGYNPPMGVDTEFSLTNWFEMQKYNPERFNEAIRGFKHERLR